MITLQEWKLIGITLIALFFISAIIYALIVEIVMRMKNKIKKSRRRQVICKKHKNVFSIDFDEFVKANFGNVTYLYENKNRVAELIRLVG